jgi:hypothetical protein
MSTLSLTSALEEGWMVNATPWPLYPLERDPVPVLQEAGWPMGPVWTGAENIAPTGFRNLDRPARSVVGYTDYVVDGNVLGA